MLSARLQAPADQPAGGRGGWRLHLSALALAGALVALLVSSLNGQSGNGRFGRLTTFEYGLDGPPWTHTVLVSAALALVTGAILVWVARRPAVLLLGVAIVPAAGAVAVAADIERRTAGRVSPEEVRSLGLGASRDDVTSALGGPAGTGDGTLRGGTEVDCLWYVDSGPGLYDSGQWALCFDDDRLVYRRRM